MDRIYRISAWATVGIFVTVFFLVPSENAFSVSLPKSTQQVLKNLKVDPSILSDIDQELAVPKEWLEKAKKEKPVRMISTSDPNVIRRLFAPFKERYPFIDIEYSFGAGQARVLKPLVAYKAGSNIAEVLTSIGQNFHVFKKANALEDLRMLPGYKNVPEDFRDPDGFSAGIFTQFYCLGYNTKLVQKKDLPETWEDLLTNPKWRGGNLAVANRPAQWALMLWKVKGEEWGRKYLTRLFTEVKPQLRKEGLTALPKFLAAGEFQGFLPAGSGILWERVLEGAPIALACPEPAPLAFSEVIVMKGGPSYHATMIFVNWLLSKESQINRFDVEHFSPAHKDLRRAEFIPFGQEIARRTAAPMDPTILLETLPKLSKFWRDLWLGTRR